MKKNGVSEHFMIALINYSPAFDRYLLSGQAGRGE